MSEDARFNDSFDSLDLRLSRSFALGSRSRIEAIVECFNVFNVTNILGVSKSNYSGFTNVLVRDSSDPADPGYLRSSSLRHARSPPRAASSARAARGRFQLGAPAQLLSDPRHRASCGGGSGSPPPPLSWSAAPSGSGSS